MLLARRPDGNFNVLTESGEEFHKPSDREVTRAIPHRQRNLRLLHAEDFGDLNLCQAAVFEDRRDLQGELCLEQLLLGIGKAKVQGSTEARFSRTVTFGPWSNRFILTSEGLMRR